MPRDSDGEEEEEEEDKGALLSWEAILPDELLQKILSLLPIANIIKLSIVCKRWYEVVHSFPPLSWAMMAPQKPLFFRSCFNDCAFSGIVYDPSLLRWCNFDFPRLERGIWYSSSSCGLVCLMNSNNGDENCLILVGNPIKRDWKLLPQVPGDSSPNSISLALSFDRRTRAYTVVVLKCTSTYNHLPGVSFQQRLSVHIYQSTTKSWATPIAQDLDLLMGNNDAVICDGLLYYFIRPYPVRRPQLVVFDLAKMPSTIESLIQESIPAPFEKIGRVELINMSNKLVMVSRIDRPRKRVVILELEDKTWRKVAQMPNSMYKTIDGLNFTFCGGGHFLFMHFKGPVVLTFDMRQKVWKWSSQLCLCPRQRPYTKFRSLCYCSFCFEPRLDVSS
ncbi:F-box/kelch-repeat protein At3g61590-like [Zingiber officinale]|uniref:F-box/kelch-repeat protein At3g61590-like n=1 Tax=Zingiber officinale TaxID=94328 RepID=UPI001C4C7410|nr:F-box/kelch-repeat protein At3g61590-like [Zingiber officinale]